MTKLFTTAAIVGAMFLAQLAHAGLGEGSNEPPKPNNEGVVTVQTSPNMKAPSTRNIDTAGDATTTSRAAAVPSVTVGGIARSADGKHLKCWQHGRLLVDQRVTVMPAEAPVGRSRVLDAESGAELVTFDLKNALCIVE